jgi:hypothetical protein
MDDGLLKLFVNLREISSEDLIDFRDDSGDCSSYNSVASLDLWQKWLSRCSLNHHECKSRATFMPTRLIDVHDEHPKLVLAADFRDAPRYATLSHCCKSLSFPS